MSKEIREKGGYENIENLKGLDRLDYHLDQISDIIDDIGMKNYNNVLEIWNNKKIAEMLNFNQINIEKHGYDAKKDDIFLEIKNASYYSIAINASFNDTNLEKAADFKKDNTYITLCVSDAFCRVAFIIHGQNSEIGNYLEERVTKSKTRTQTITMKNLIVKYGFDIIPIHSTREECIDLIMDKIKINRNVLENQMKNIEEVETFDI